MTDPVPNSVTNGVTDRVPHTAHINKQKEKGDEKINKNSSLYSSHPVSVPRALREAWTAYADARRTAGDPMSDEEAADKLQIVQNYSSNPDSQIFFLRCMTSTVKKQSGLHTDA